jgi:GNAT superfamily N-acetyltransferase
MLIREAGRDEDELVVRHYRALWESYGVGDENIRPDAEQVVRDFITSGRDRYEMAAFLAEIDGQVVGSTACQLHHLPYPAVTTAAFSKYGYIWHVFTDPAARRRGVATQLVQRAVDHLRAIGCTKAVLHASDAGEPVYRQLGFAIAKEMRLDL